MFLPPVLELTLVGVVDPGVPNQERVVLRPTESVNLSQFGLLIGWRNSDGSVVPVFDNFFWFGEIEVTPPSWILVYTGSGFFRKSVVPTSGQCVLSMYWGRSLTAFNVPQQLPVLFRIGSVLIGGQQPPKLLP
jgi:hypothetical protein